MRFIPLSLLLAVLVGCTNEGEFHARNDEFRAAHEAYRRLEQELGEHSPEWLFDDMAYAALKIGELDQAEAALNKAGVHGAPGSRNARRLMMGNILDARWDRAVLLARRVEAGIPEWDAAMLLADRTVEVLHACVLENANSPLALENLEIALRKRETMIKEREKALKEKARKDDPRNRPKRPRPKPEPAETEEVPDEDTKAILGHLSSEEVERLLKKLEQKEAAKRRVRHVQRAHRTRGVERDW